MTIKLQAFLSLEESLATRMQLGYAKASSALFASTQRLIEARDWDAAVVSIQALDLTSVVEDNDAYIRYLSQVAVLFGASRVNRTPATSLVGLGFEKQAVDITVDAFKRAVTSSMRDRLISTAVQLIAIERAKSDSAATAEGGTYLWKVLKASGGKASGILPFQSFMDKQGRAEFQTASSLHTSRLSAFGFTAEAEYLGITRYKITEQLDGRTCVVCQTMHGKEFQVSDAKALLDIVIRTQDPDELKALQPWPRHTADAIASLSSMAPSELVSHGWHVPPFHPRCRGLLEASGSVQPLGQPQGPEPYEASSEDFKQLGILFPPSKIKLWNTILPTPPSDVFAKLLGVSTSELLQQALVASSQPLGTTSLSATSTAIKLEMKALIHGSKSPVYQDLYFRKDKSLFVGSIDLGGSPASVLKKTLLGIYQAAKLTGMDRISLIASGGVEGWAFAKYGFIPTAKSWKALTALIKKSPDRMALITKAHPLLAKAAMMALNSPNPVNVMILSELPFGKALLSGASWAGELVFDQVEPMLRFTTTMGPYK